MRRSFLLRSARPLGVSRLQASCRLRAAAAATRPRAVQTRGRENPHRFCTSFPPSHSLRQLSEYSCRAHGSRLQLAGFNIRCRQRVQTGRDARNQVPRTGTDRRWMRPTLASHSVSECQIIRPRCLGMITAAAARLVQEGAPNSPGLNGRLPIKEGIGIVNGIVNLGINMLPQPAAVHLLSSRALFLFIISHGVPPVDLICHLAATPIKPAHHGPQISHISILWRSKPQ